MICYKLTPRRMDVKPFPTEMGEFNFKSTKLRFHSIRFSLRRWKGLLASKLSEISLKHSTSRAEIYPSLTNTKPVNLRRIMEKRDTCNAAPENWFWQRKVI